MSLALTVFGRRHYLWRDQAKVRAWFYRPDEHSSGGVGFKFVCVHVVFYWGLR